MNKLNSYKDVIQEKILIVEDNLAYASCVKIMLKQIGIKCDIVSHSRDLLDVIKKKYYPLVIMDYDLGNTSANGKEMTTMLKQYDPNIVVIANSSDDNHNRWMINKGAYRKPARKDSLNLIEVVGRLAKLYQIVMNRRLE